MGARFEDIDVQRCPMRRVGVQGTQIIYDHGPLPPLEPSSRAEMRQYHVEHEEWLRGTGGRPYRIALNSVDARAALMHPRYSRSATEREPMQPQQRDTKNTATVINLVAQSGGGAAFGGFWLLDLISGNKYVVFSCDRPAWLATGQFVETTPSA
jgi:hypothetical protein